MSETEQPKSPREIWSDMIKESYILNSDEREMMSTLDDDLIELALASRSSISFMQELSKKDSDFSLHMSHKDIPIQYRLIMQLLNKRRPDQKIRKQK